jgi:hypothetical protein
MIENVPDPPYGYSVGVPERIPPALMTNPVGKVVDEKN